MRLNVTSRTVDDVGDTLSRVGEVSVVVNNRRHIDGVVSNGPHTLIPMNVTSHVSIDVVLEHDTLESSTHVPLVRGDLRRVHGPVRHSNDPWCLGSVDSSKILGEPVDLLESGVVGVASVDVAEWTTVSDEGLLLGGKGLVGQCADVSNEGVLRRGSVVGLSVKRDEMSHAVIE